MTLSARRGARFAALATTLGLALTACGGGGGGLSAPTDPPASTDAPVTTEDPTTTTAADEATTTAASTEGNLDTVKQATVQIVAQGTFVDPEVGQFESAGAGSGFIVDASGIAVTNHHVVGGAGLLEVYVPGDDRPHNAKILGVSECSDLAVIDIDGAGYPALGWYDGGVDAGLEIYAAGYPLGNPEFTLTRGIVSKAEAGGDTTWSSVDHVIEHDANTQPGNSGGPVVTADGEVVGVHFAGGSQTNTSQFFAIGGDIAQSVVETLAGGEDLDTIGINGSAVYDEELGLAGVWVSGVDSGSPADLAGVLPGDIIQKIEGVSLGTDGTMGAYCDVLRTHDATDPMSIEVLRLATSELLAGQLNGRPLATTVSFAEEYEEEVTDDGGSASAAPEYAEYQLVTDDSGAISMEVPVEWSQVDGVPVDMGSGNPSPAIVASTDLTSYYETYDVPGVTAVAAAEFAGYTADELLDLAAQDASCLSEGRDVYESDRFAGSVEFWSSCAGTPTSVVVVSGHPTSLNYGFVLIVQATSDADLVALDQILATFNVAIS